MVGCVSQFSKACPNEIVGGGSLGKLRTPVSAGWENDCPNEIAGDAPLGGLPALGGAGWDWASPGRPAQITAPNARRMKRPIAWQRLRLCALAASATSHVAIAIAALLASRRFKRCLKTTIASSPIDYSLAGKPAPFDSSLRRPRALHAFSCAVGCCCRRRASASRSIRGAQARFPYGRVGRRPSE